VWIAGRPGAPVLAAGVAAQNWPAACPGTLRRPVTPPASPRAC